ncbi:MAG: DNA recombination protein RmuC [Planctomycetes bacterium]|nr:DNA recombination protein RmuC [Planctomycetota bacterium]
MAETLGVVAVVLLALVLALQVAALLRRQGPQTAALEGRLEAIHRALREEHALGRDATTAAARDLRQEVSATLEKTGTAQRQAAQDAAALLRTGLDDMSSRLRELADRSEKSLEDLRGTVERRLTDIQQDNAQKLEAMRRTVDEKLHETLERRLGESFRTVQGLLEQVHRGLGEVQAVAGGVGDLKKVLTNVKTRGTWGEVQLGNLLEQILAPSQFETNVRTKEGSREFVEFAIRLPGRNGTDSPVRLPVDAKFPIEDYQRLVEASERADVAGVAAASKALEERVRSCARDIRDKYIDPPHTTDFAILYLPSEGLYAEVLRKNGTVESLQRDYRVTVAGPTTLGAFLNSLQLGFRTLAIEKRSSEVWKTLGAVKTEFEKFGDAIDKVQKKLQEAASAVDATHTRRHVLERKLRDVEALPESDAATLLDLPAAPPPEETI